MHALRHVSTAIEHAERLAEEAEELSLPALAGSLREHAKALSFELEQALAALDRVPPARDARQRAHAHLAAVYAEVTHDLSRLLPIDAAAQLSPGGHLDVAERSRFRLRRLMAEDVSLAPLSARLQGALGAYEKAVDTYLLASADGNAKRDRAIAESQRLRLDLERAKLTLLSRAEVGSDTWRRIKRRTVRTKPARWLAPRGEPRLPLAA